MDTQLTLTPYVAHTPNHFVLLIKDVKFGGWKIIGWNVAFDMFVGFG
jgi:hypothetical protein